MGGGEILKPEDRTETWGTYEGDFYANQPGMTFRNLGKGTVTYIGIDSQNGDIERDVMRKFYSRLGIELENLPDGLHIENRDGFGIAVNYSDKTQTLSLPSSKKYLAGRARSRPPE